MASAQTGKFEAAVQSGMIKLDALPENIAKTANKLVKDGAVGLKDAVMLGAYADQFMQAENDKIAKDYRMLQTDLLRQQQKDSSALAGVVATLDIFRNPEGNLDRGKLIQAYAAKGGTNLTPLAKMLESMEIEPGFVPFVKQVEVPGTGRMVTIVQTGPKTSQVVPEEKEPRVPAQVQALAEREKFANEASKLWKDGKRDEAYAKMFAAGAKNQFGGPITMDDLEAMWGASQKAESPKAKSEPNKEIRVKF
jgi:hypothetical protein